MEFVFWVESQHLKEQLFHARKYSGFWSLNSSVGSKSLLIIGDSQANYKLKEPTWGASKLCWPQGTNPTELAVDVGCGSGQGTRFLAERFGKVVGTDISQAQIQEAKAAPSPPNVSYLVCPAEELPFEDASVDLLASFTAAHWFDIEKFMREVNRVVRPGGCVAISTYTVDMSLHYGTCSEKLTQIFRETWGQLLKYSHNRVKHVLEDYKEIFEALPFPDKKRITDIYDKIPMTVAGVVGYLESASPYQVFMKNDPEAAKTLLPEMEKRLLEVMGVPSRETPLEFWVRHVCILGHKEA